MDYRQERRQLKQELFAIRRHVEGEDVKLTKRLKELKEQYEAVPGFTSWSDFPEKWDIGDPNQVKINYVMFEDASVKWADKRDYKKAMGSGLDEIVHKDSHELLDRIKNYTERLKVVGESIEEAKKAKDAELLAKHEERLQIVSERLKEATDEFEKWLTVSPPKSKKEGDK